MYRVLLCKNLPQQVILLFQKGNFLLPVTVKLLKKKKTGKYFSNMHTKAGRTNNDHCFLTPLHFRRPSRQRFALLWHASWMLLDILRPPSPPLFRFGSTCFLLLFIFRFAFFSLSGFFRRLVIVFFFVVLRFLNLHAFTVLCSPPRQDAESKEMFSWFEITNFRGKQEKAGAARKTIALRMTCVQKAFVILVVLQRLDNGRFFGLWSVFFTMFFHPKISAMNPTLSGALARNVQRSINCSWSHPSNLSSACNAPWWSPSSKL